MGKIIPFKAVRPTRYKVSLVASRSYKNYTTAELAFQLDFNPFSFLHILNPTYSNQQIISIEKYFKLVAKKYSDFKDENILKQETKPFFFYMKFNLEIKHLLLQLQTFLLQIIRKTLLKNMKIPHPTVRNFLKIIFI